MSTGENIRNAVKVLQQTYENVSKLMDHSKSIADEAGYVVVSEKFLRWRTDAEPTAWLINNFILLFQSKENEECVSGNGWRNGPVYAMEVCLSGEGYINGMPHLLLSKFEYNEIDQWKHVCSPADYWGYHQPVDKAFAKQFYRTEKDGYLFSMPVGAKATASYWGLKRAITLAHPLMDVTSSNLKDVVFGNFDQLSKVI